MSTDHNTRIEERIRLCKCERRSYEIWLKTLTPVNFLLVGVGGVLSLIAGLSIVTEASLIGPKVAGWIAIFGAVLTGLHNRLKCEPHQVACKKLVNQFSELQTDYERLQLEINEQKCMDELKAVEQKLAVIRAGRGATASTSSVKRAKQEIGEQSEADNFT